MKILLMGALALALAIGVPVDSQAKRLGGGQSAGMQRSMPQRTAPEAVPAKPATPPQQAQVQPAPGAAAAAQAVPQKRSWLGPIAGLAAGLGIAALMSHMGFGEGMGNVVMLALLAGAAVFLVMFLIRRFAPGAGSASPAFAGAGTGAGGPRAGPSWAPLQPMADPSVVPGRLPQPLAPQTGLTGDPAPASAAVAAPALSRAFVPASFDSQGFARTAKTIFIRMQAANDAADLDDLRRFTTPELFAALKLDLLERGSAKQTTDVVEVNADVLDVASETDRDIVSVRFHGRVVEEQGAAPVSFDEIWHLIRPLASNDAWLIAGIEQSQSR